MSNPEVAADFSSGGFSNYFKRPPFQDEVVPTFLKGLGGQYTGLYKWVRCSDLNLPILTL